MTSYTSKTGSALLTGLFYATLGPLFLSLTLVAQLGFSLSPLATGLEFSPLAAASAITVDLIEERIDVALRVRTNLVSSARSRCARLADPDGSWW